MLGVQAEADVQSSSQKPQRRLSNAESAGSRTPNFLVQMHDTNDPFLKASFDLITNPIRLWWLPQSYWTNSRL